MRYILLLLFFINLNIVNSQTIFEYDIVETKIDRKFETKEISGTITLDKDWKEIQIEYGGFISRDSIGELESKTELTDRIKSYGYYLGEGEHLSIFTFNDKIYAIYIQTISGKWSCIKYLRKYL